MREGNVSEVTLCLYCFHALYKSKCEKKEDILYSLSRKYNGKHLGLPFTAVWVLKLSLHIGR